MAELETKPTKVSVRDFIKKSQLVLAVQALSTVPQPGNATGP